MGFLDSALNSILSSGGAGGGTPQFAQLLEGLIQQHGGLGGLVQQLSQGGLGQQVQSWIATGANQAITGSQITQALGSGKITQIAQQLGVDPQQAGGLLAQVLPHVIDHLTPNGQLPAGAAQTPSSGLLGAALSALSTRL
jgi:uncharacterized protein YidB (DUF937 family)